MLPAPATPSRGRGDAGVAATGILDYIFRMTFTPLIMLSLIVVGLSIGIVSGMIGLGGGMMVIPALIYIYGFSQQKANGTSLAMLLPPIGFLAVITYDRAKNVDWKVAMLLAAGFVIGAWVGGWLSNSGKIPELGLRVIFSMLLLYVAGRI